MCDREGSLTFYRSSKRKINAIYDSTEIMLKLFSTVSRTERDFSLLGICTPLSCFFHHLVLLETLQLRYLQAAFCSTSVSGASAASAAFLCQSKASFNYLLCIPLLLSLCIHWWARCMLWNSVARTAWWWALPGAIRVTCCHTGLLLAHQPIAWDQHSAVSDGIFQDSADK